LIDDNGFALWSLSMKKKKTNGLLDLLRKIVIDWWTSETRVSPNKSHVTQRRLEAMVYNEIITNKNECKIYILYIKATMSVCLSVRAVPGKLFQSLPVPYGVFCRGGGGAG